MDNVEKTAWKIQASCPQGRVLTIDQALVVANALEEAGLLAPAPQIVRTMEELETLAREDADAIVLASESGVVRTARALAAMRQHGSVWGLPAVVIATGDQVRYAREAMEQENGL